jgi:hypothetical protein
MDRNAMLEVPTVGQPDSLHMNSVKQHKHDNAWVLSPAFTPFDMLRTGFDKLRVNGKFI